MKRTPKTTTASFVRKKLRRNTDKPKVKATEGDKFIVRLYDGFDNQWCDVTGPVSKEEADRIYDKETNNGTKATNFSDIDYYRIFPAGTKMMFSDGFGER